MEKKDIARSSRTYSRYHHGGIRNDEAELQPFLNNYTNHFDRSLDSRSSCAGLRSSFNDSTDYTDPSRDSKNAGSGRWPRSATIADHADRSLQKKQ